MKKVIALSISLAFSVAAIAQEQVQAQVQPTATPTETVAAPGLLEKGQNVLKGIISFSRNNQAAPVSEKPTEAENTPKEETSAKVEQPIVAPTVETKAPTVVVENVKSEVKATPTTSEVATKTKETPSVPTQVKPVAEVKTNAEPKVEFTPPTKPVAVDIKPPVKKKLVVKKKVKVKETKVAVIEPSAVLLSAETFHIPKNLTEEEVAQITGPIKESDVGLEITKVEDSFAVSLIDLRINKPLDQHYLKNNKLHTLSTNSDLSKISFKDIRYENNNGYNISFVNSGKCEIIFAQFELKTSKNPTTFVQFLDQDGNLKDELDKECSLNNLDKKDSTFTTNQGGIINIGFSGELASQGKLGATVHFGKDGKEYFPNDLKLYAIKADLSSFVKLENKNNKSPFWGVAINQKVEPSTYYILLGHKQNQNYEWIKTVTSVQ